jgi:hypothetical protein
MIPALSRPAINLRAALRSSVRKKKEALDS